MVDFKLQLIFTVLAFTKSDNCEFWTCCQFCASAETILDYNVLNIDMQLENQSFTKTSHLLK